MVTLRDLKTMNSKDRGALNTMIKTIKYCKHCSGKPYTGKPNVDNCPWCGNRLEGHEVIMELESLDGRINLTPEYIIKEDIVSPPLKGNYVYIDEDFDDIDLGDNNNGFEDFGIL